MAVIILLEKLLLCSSRCKQIYEWMNKFYFANERIDNDMSYKKYKLKELH